MTGVDLGIFEALLAATGAVGHEPRAGLRKSAKRFSARNPP